MKRGIVHPKYWLRHWRVRRALVGYPLYDVPHKTREADLTEAQVQENFAYFMRVRQERLTFFFDWLRQKFGVAASLTPEGALAIDRWVRDFGGGAIRDITHDMGIFATYAPDWKGKFVGYNVMIDLGIFIGEYLIWRRPELYWEIYRGHEIEPETFSSYNYLKPTIGGMPGLWKADVTSIGRGVILDAVKRCIFTIDGPIYAHNSLISDIKQCIYLSKMPDDVIFIGDSTNEPL